MYNRSYDILIPCRFNHQFASNECTQQENVAYTVSIDAYYRGIYILFVKTISFSGYFHKISHALLS